MRCEAPPPTPLICLAETYALTSLAPISNDAYQLWLDAGYTCDTKWDAVCATDNAYGAEHNSAPSPRWIATNATRSGSARTPSTTLSARRWA